MSPQLSWSMNFAICSWVSLIQACSLFAVYFKVCAYKDGEVIIDTAAGVLGKYDPRPVQPDSLFSVFSATKGICAGLVHWLVDNGYVMLINSIYSLDVLIFSPLDMKFRSF